MNKMSAVNTQTIVVGVDVHKYSHTAVALDCFGSQIGLMNSATISFRNTFPGLMRLETETISLWLWKMSTDMASILSENWQMKESLCVMYREF